MPPRYGAPLQGTNIDPEPLNRAHDRPACRHLVHYVRCTH